MSGRSLEAVEQYQAALNLVQSQQQAQARRQGRAGVSAPEQQPPGVTPVGLGCLQLSLAQALYACEEQPALKVRP